MGTEAPPSKRAKLAYTETFDVLVGRGEDAQCFTVYKDKLCRRSEFFEASTGERWKKGEKKPVDLCDEEPEIFAAYLDCVYVQHLAPETFVDCAEKGEKGGEGTKLVKLYLLANKILDTASANIAISEIIYRSKKAGHPLNQRAIEHAYGHTLPGSKLRKLLVDYYVHEAVKLEAEGEHSALFSQFLLEVWTEFARIKSTKPKLGTAFWNFAGNSNSCCYHEHDDGHPRCKQVV